jgi:hypothetical protein
VIGMRKPDYDRWYADKVQQVKDARTRAAETTKALEGQAAAGDEAAEGDGQ